jgi:hypothetical protein
MSTPIIEYIALNIESTINAVTTANGFNYDLTALRPKRNDYKTSSPADLTVLIIQGAEEVIKQQDNATHRFRQEFDLQLICLESDDAETSIDTKMNKIVSDIRKKMLEDIYRGNYAIDTQIAETDKFDNGQGFTGVNIKFIVEYRTAYGNPYA